MAMDGAVTASRRSAVVRLADVAREVLAGPPRLGAVRLVCIDGRAGAGKSTLAGRLASFLGDAQIVHLDDLYEGWSGLPRVWDRLDSWVLQPLRANFRGRYQRYDWESGSYAEWHDVPVRPALIVEGVGSADRAIDHLSTLKMWVDAPLDVRYRRAIERDGEGFRPYWDAWAADEDLHFARERTAERADVVVDGDSALAYDEETEIVILG
ncbi:nucleoside/nucleotide kinase family protein [Tenggerimyces flavus]|uniref:Uridine kinase n=1 Tax=Tenggerimyces flavus TaxID=1708749 RepID=A0ABV7YKJ1_9ACTN|nr:uridine kinase [Tenggerimyces flavus]MBM7787412.1 uridine kinase [Tenggerimyces flavus]